MNENTTGNRPASLASSSLGMPLILLYFTDEHFLFSCVWALNFTQFRILSTIPQLVAWRGGIWLAVIAMDCDTMTHRISVQVEILLDCSSGVNNGRL